MQNGRLQLFALFGACVVAVWLFAPVLRVWETLLVGTALALGIAATVGMVLVRTKWAKAGTVWGDGSLFRVAQGVGLALFVYGSVQASTPLIFVGALCFAVGSIIEISKARLHRST